MRSIIVMVILCVILYSSIAQGVTVRWDLEIFTNNGNYYNDPDADFYFLLSEDNSFARFEFYNESLFSSSVTAIYFEGDALTGISSIVQSSGVSFSSGGAPPNLPGGNNLSPNFFADFHATANPPPSLNGVNNMSGEWVALLVNMSNGVTINDINQKLMSGEIRVGVHIQSFPDGSSESAINIPHTPIPEPTVMGLIATAGLGMLWKRRKK